MESIYNNSSSSCNTSESKKWSCSRCTYLNWPKSLRCIQCESPRARECLNDIFGDLKINENEASQNQQHHGVGALGGGGTNISPSPNHKLTSERILDYYENPGLGRGLSVSSSLPLNNRRTNNSISSANSHSDGIGATSNNTINSPNINRLTNTTSGVDYQSRSSPTSTTTSTTMITKNSSSSDKWSCLLCTYDNWPRASKCVMCLTPRGRNSPGGNVGVDYGAGLMSMSSHDESDRLGLGLGILHPNNRAELSLSGNNRLSCTVTSRRGRDVDSRWLEACRGVVDGDLGPVEIYLAAGGDPSRQLTQTEVTLLNRPSAFDVGLTLIHLALRFHQENLLATLLSQVEGTPPVVKRVPAFAAPDLAMDIRRHFLSCLRQRKGHFRCYYTAEIATFTLPSEIEDYQTEIQETLFDELLDRDVQKELDDSQIINWSPEIVDQLNSRLYALWNRSAGDCLLDSVLQATWGIFDRENGLRQALSESLQDCATLFYQRWRENELLHATLLDFSLNDSQCAADWSKLLSIASKPGSSLEQLHIFALAHILRRPIIVYGVKYVKSFRGETLGFARYEGLYLPFFWEPGFCWKSPIALGYTRGHFSALITMEPDCDPMSVSVGTAAQLVVPDDINSRCSYLPLTSVDGNLLPIHFLLQSEIGKEELIMNQWLDVRFTETGVMVACQQVQKLPVLVGQMIEEWLNHYRRLGQLDSGPFLRPSGTTTCYSSEAESDND